MRCGGLWDGTVWLGRYLEMGQYMNSWRHITLTLLDFLDVLHIDWASWLR